MKINLQITITKSEHKQATLGIWEKRLLRIREMGIWYKFHLMLPVHKQPSWLQNHSRRGCSFIHIKHRFLLWKYAIWYKGYQAFAQKTKVKTKPSNGSNYIWFFKHFLQFSFLLKTECRSVLLDFAMCSFIIICVWNVSSSPCFA